MLEIPVAIYDSSNLSLLFPRAPARGYTLSPSTMAFLALFFKEHTDAKFNV